MPDSEVDRETILESRAEMERDHFALIADEDVTFPEDPSPSAPLTDWDW